MAAELVFMGYVCALATFSSISLENECADQQSQFRTPERFVTGKFDIWGNSHQIFHVFILCAMYTNTIALTQAFTACHTLDICSIAAAHRAGQK